MSIWTDINGWPIPPFVLLGCLAVEFLYFRGWCVLIKDTQHPYATGNMHLPASTDANDATMLWKRWFWRGIFFLGASFSFLLAAWAPIDNLSGRLFWVHMIQHLLLLVVMAPLLVASAPLMPLWAGLPARLRRFIKLVAQLKGARIFHWLWSWLQQPAIACALLFVGIWIWHWPPLYDLALTNDTIHDWCEHLTFIAVSILFWTQVIPSPPLYPRLGYLGRMGCIGFAILQNFVLALLIGFAQAPLYAPYAHLATIAGGFSALQDQQFGAGIMWTFGDIPFGVALSILLQQWLISQSDDARITRPSLHSAEVSTPQKTEHAL